MMEIMREHTKDYTELYQFERMLWYSSYLVPKMRDRGFCMFVRLGNSSHLKIMEKFTDLQPRILYSMWKGYLDEPKTPHSWRDSLSTDCTPAVMRISVRYGQLLK